MKTVILPIKKEYCRLIFNGYKRVEYRRKFPKEGIGKILVYESRGCGRIIGELTVEIILHMPVDSLWESTHEHGGTDRDSFERYFSGKEYGFGIVLKDAVLYKKPIGLSELGIESIPQNYIYSRTQVSTDFNNHP